MSARPRIEAELFDDDDGWSLVLHRRLPFESTDVWAALTDPARLAEWAPFTADRDLTTVGTLELTERNTAHPRTLGGAVLEVQPARMLIYEWGGEILRWDLRSDDTGTELTLRHRFTDRGQAPDFAAGWHLCLDALSAALAGNSIPEVVGDGAVDHGWPELRQRYAMKFNHLDNRGSHD